MSGAYQFDLMESADGITYSSLFTHTDTQNSLTNSYQYFTSVPASTTRYLKFIYTLKVGGNIPIDDVLIDIDTRVSSLEAQEISIYPNPAKSVLYINNAQNSSIVITDMVGKIISNQISEKENLSLNISDLAPGIYMIRFVNNNGAAFVKKFIKQ